jgi:hypothetical protein
MVPAQRIKSTVCTRMRDARSGCAADCADLIQESIFLPRRLSVLFPIDILDSWPPSPVMVTNAS